MLPVIPNSSERILRMLNCEKTNWDNCGNENLKDGHQLNKAEIIFPKIEDEIIQKQMDKLNMVEDKKPEKDSELISYEDFMKTQLKVAEVIEAEKLEKSEKLMKLKVRLGNEERQVIAGIAKNYKAEDLINKKVVMVANLKPAKLMGLESQGMILAAEDEEGKLKVISVDDSVLNGSRVK